MRCIRKLPVAPVAPQPSQELERRSCCIPSHIETCAPVLTFNNTFRSNCKPLEQDLCGSATACTQITIELQPTHTKQVNRSHGYPWSLNPEDWLRAHPWVGRQLRTRSCSRPALGRTWTVRCQRCTAAWRRCCRR